ncbi:hypothetical protein DB346_09270 [Verrucomicrobia bacterium LW23]|nr:hypothetical protein DB346_09270 [Verrucomicrobia bacterium LW23]
MSATKLNPAPSSTSPHGSSADFAAPWAPIVGQCARGADRVLFALSRQERDLFFPRLSDADLGNLGGWVDTTNLRALAAASPVEGGASPWLRLLRHVRPTVLVSAWTTPMLPEEWTREHDLPLRYVCHLTGSVRGLVRRGVIERGVMVSNWGSTISHTIAEHAMMLVLNMLRNVPAWFPHYSPVPGNVSGKGQVLGTRSLRGRRVGLHGFGAIARELVAMLRPFQVDLAAWSPGVPRALYEEFGVTPLDSLEELFERSDVLIECEGLTPTTAGSVTEAVLRRLPEGAVFVNIGRAAVTDETAVLRLAAEGRIRAALDVYNDAAVAEVFGDTAVPDPLAPPGTRLTGPPLPVMLSPHLAGPTPDACPRSGDFALDNLERYFRGDKPGALISLEVYDRST